MRKTIAVVLMIVILVSVSACGNGPDTQAQNEMPNDQIMSNDVEEDPCINGHTWVEATCETPKTCSVCGITEGEPLGHDWSFATLEEPKTCKNCGATVGDTVKCREIDLSFINNDDWYVVCPYRDMIFCGIMHEDVEGYPINITLYNYDGSIRKVIETEPSKEYGAGYGHFPDRFWIRVGSKMTFYDLDGNEQKSYELDVSNIGKSGASVNRCNDDRYLKIELGGSNNKTYYIDKDTMELLDGEEMDLSLYYDYDYDKEKYSYVVKDSQRPDRFFVANKDKTKWGYTDDKFNELAMYKDASDFNCFGYAFVTENGESYDIIDSDFNVVAKDYIQGVSTALWGENCDDPILCVDTDSGRKLFYVEYDDPEKETTMTASEPVKETSTFEEPRVDLSNDVAGMQELLDSRMGDYISDRVFDIDKFTKDTNASTWEIWDSSFVIVYGSWFIQAGKDSSHPDVSCVAIGNWDYVNTERSNFYTYSYLFPSGDDISVDGKIVVPTECIIHLKDIFGRTAIDGTKVAPNVPGTLFKPCDSLNWLKQE